MNKTDEAAIEQARSQFGEPLAPPEEGGLSDQKRIQFLQAAVAVDLSRIEQLEKALKDLAFAARISGGIAGRDAALCAVCDYAEGVLNGDERLYGATPETIELRIVPTGWVRWIPYAGSPVDPPEYDAECVVSDDQPPGEGWVPLYRKVAPGIPLRPALKANVHCDGCGQDYVASLGHLCPAVNGNPQA